MRSTAACSRRVDHRRARAGGAARAARDRRAALRARESAPDRSHGLLGVRRQRGLASPHGDAAQGRLRKPAAERRGPRVADAWDLEGQRGRPAMQGVRRRRHHAPARAAAHHLAGRQHAAGRFRCRHANAAAAASTRQQPAGEKTWQGHSLRRMAGPPGRRRRARSARRSATARARSRQAAAAAGSAADRRLRLRSTKAAH